MAEPRWQAKLSQTISYHLDEGDLRVLCYDLGVDYERLAGGSKADKVTALVEFCERRGLVRQCLRTLLALLKTLRPLRPDARAAIKDISGIDVKDSGHWVKVEFLIGADIISFGNQKRAELIQHIAEQFNIEQDEIHVLTEAGADAKHVRLMLGMSQPDARSLASPADMDSRFDRLHKEFSVRQIRLIDQPGRWERLSLWKSHRLRGLLRLLLYFSGLAVFALMGTELAALRFPEATTRERELWATIAALPGFIVWIALLAILTRFMQIIYDLGPRRQTFEYLFLSLFGPLFFRYPFVFVSEGQVEAKSKKLPQGDPDGPGGPCLYIIFNDSAVVLERGGRRIGIAGPSVYTAGRYEKIYQTLDLCPQTRTTVADVITREGIPLKTQVGVTFRIRWRGEPTAKFPYPADPDALVQAAAGLAVFKTDRGVSVRTWADRVGGNLDIVLRTIIARYRLDELMEPRDPGLRPRSDLMRNYTEALRGMARNFGAEITEVRVEPFEFDIDLPIKQQWMDTWREAWAGQVRVREAQAQASAIRMREMAHAYAQLEMIAAITREFQPRPGIESLPMDLITLRFVEVISKMVANPESAIYLPHEALQTLDGVRKMLKEAKAATPSLTGRHLSELGEGDMTSDDPK
jgi:regulator of protease activity HflC (stomatin/prohibitin superfamily)